MNELITPGVIITVVICATLLVIFFAGDRGK